jgi:hypothetical protein
MPITYQIVRCPIPVSGNLFTSASSSTVSNLTLQSHQLIRPNLGDTGPAWGESVASQLEEPPGME